MKFIDALQLNAANLSTKAAELCDRVNLLRAHGHTADATIAELVKTNRDISVLSDAIANELARAEMKVQQSVQPDRREDATPG